jgi:MinD-like ATPase involved in chromosome partitioning or flagellar assembly
VRPNLWLLAANINLVGAETELVNVVGREIILREAMQSCRDQFDFCLIDCAPSLGLLSLNALAAAEEVLIPLQPHFLALQGFGKLLQTVDLVNKRINPRLKVTGVLLCMHDTRTSLSNEVHSDIEQFLANARGTNSAWDGAVVLPSFIRRNIKLAEAPSYGKTIFEYDPTCNGAEDYRKVGNFFLGITDEPEQPTEPAESQPQVEAEVQTQPQAEAQTEIEPQASPASMPTEIQEVGSSGEPEQSAEPMESYPQVEAEVQTQAETQAEIESQTSPAPVPTEIREIDSSGEPEQPAEPMESQPQVEAEVRVEMQAQTDIEPPTFPAPVPIEIREVSISEESEQSPEPVESQPQVQESSAPVPIEIREVNLPAPQRYAPVPTPTEPSAPAPRPTPVEPIPDIPSEAV